MRKLYILPLVFVVFISLFVSLSIGLFSFGPDEVANLCYQRILDSDGDNRDGRCREIAEMFSQCATEYGIKNRIVTGYYLNIEAPSISDISIMPKHAWNQVLTEEGWQHVDVGMDEPYFTALFKRDRSFLPTIYFHPKNWEKITYPDGHEEILNNNVLHLSKDWKVNFKNYAWVDGGGRVVAYDMIDRE